MSIEIERVENGYLVDCDGRRWVAQSPEEVKDIVDELLEELDSENEDD